MNERLLKITPQRLKVTNSIQKAEGLMETGDSQAVLIESGDLQLQLRIHGHD